MRRSDGPTQLDPIAAVNPLTDDAAQRLALGAAEDDLLARIVASGERPEPAPSRAAPRSRGVLAVAGLAAAALPVMGAWPSVLIGSAKAMRSGSWFGRPLLSDVNSGLGCNGRWHVKLGAPRPHA